MRIKVLWILGVCVLAAACQKRKYPEEKVQLQKEDIYFNGYLGDQPVSLKIGTDGYYCYSSFEQRPDSVYVFKGELKRFDCNPCPLALQVQLSDGRKLTPGAAIEVDSAFKTGNRRFIPGLEKTNSFKFLSHANKQVASIHWDLSNGTSSDDAILSCEFGQPGPQTVSLTVRTTGNCESKVVNKIYNGGANGFLACSIESKTLQGNSAEFTSIPMGGNPSYTYTWYFGDGSVSHAANPTHTYPYAGSYPVKLQVTDADQHTCESNFIYIAGNDNSSCAANMSLTYTGSSAAILNGVKIQWTDPSNIVLKSDKIAQPAGSYFEIINSQPYATNERGEPGRLLTFRFNVLLSDGSRNLWFKSDNTAIAVTYK